MTKLVESRENYPYKEERITPVEEIPKEFQSVTKLGAGNIQITDNRLCYNWEPGEDGGRYVECGSVATAAGK